MTDILDKNGKVIDKEFHLSKEGKKALRELGYPNCGGCNFWSHNLCHLKDELRFKTDVACSDKE